MNKTVTAVMIAGFMAAFSQPAAAAKVGDPCTPKGGGAGHFVRTYAAGLTTIKCKADPTVARDTPAVTAERPRPAADELAKTPKPEASPKR